MLILVQAIKHTHAHTKRRVTALKPAWQVNHFVRNRFNISKAPWPHIQGTDGGGWRQQAMTPSSCAFPNTRTPQHTNTHKSPHIGPVLQAATEFWCFSVTLRLVSCHWRPHNSQLHDTQQPDPLFISHQTNLRGDTSSLHFHALILSLLSCFSLISHSIRLFWIVSLCLPNLLFIPFPSWTSHFSTHSVFLSLHYHGQRS